MHQLHVGGRVSQDLLHQGGRSHNQHAANAQAHTLAADRRLAMMRRAFLGSMRGSCAGAVDSQWKTNDEWSTRRQALRYSAFVPSEGTSRAMMPAFPSPPHRSRRPQQRARSSSRRSPGEGRAQAGARPCPCACETAPGKAGGAPRSGRWWEARHQPPRCWCQGRGPGRAGPRRCLHKAKSRWQAGDFQHFDAFVPAKPADTPTRHMRAPVPQNNPQTTACAAPCPKLACQVVVGAGARQHLLLGPLAPAAAALAAIAALGSSLGAVLCCAALGLGLGVGSAEGRAVSGGDWCESANGRQLSCCDLCCGVLPSTAQRRQAQRQRLGAPHPAPPQPSAQRLTGAAGASAGWAARRCAARCLH